MVNIENRATDLFKLEVQAFKAFGKILISIECAVGSGLTSYLAFYGWWLIEGNRMGLHQGNLILPTVGLLLLTSLISSLFWSYYSIKDHMRIRREKVSN